MGTSSQVARARAAEPATTPSASDCAAESTSEKYGGATPSEFMYRAIETMAIIRSYATIGTPSIDPTRPVESAATAWITNSTVTRGQSHATC